MQQIFDLAKLRWQCRRGMLELDVILLPFFEDYFGDLADQQKQCFVDLLEEADPDIYTWVMGFGHCENESLHEILDLIQIKMKIAR